MAYPEKLLSEGEQIVKETRQHWIALQNELLWSIALIVVFIILIPWLDFFADEWIFWAAVVAWIVLVFKGVTDYATTDFALTDRRVVFRKGLITKLGYEIPVERIQDVGFRQSGTQRVVGAGDLLLESAASDAKTVIENIPDPIGFKNLVSDAREKRMDERLRGPTPQAAQATSTSRAEQLDILARLYSEGKLTDTEFEAEKAKLLGS